MTFAFKPPVAKTVRSKAVVLLFWGTCNCSMFCCALLYVHSSFAIILMGKRELVALLGLYSIVVWLFLALPVCDCGIS